MGRDRDVVGGGEFVLVVPGPFDVVVVVVPPPPVPVFDAVEDGVFGGW